MKPKQLNLIVGLINQIYGKGERIEEIQFWQFKEIFETAHGVSDKTIIMKFVLTYLPFD